MDNWNVVCPYNGYRLAIKRKYCDRKTDSKKWKHWDPKLLNKWQQFKIKAVPHSLFASLLTHSLYVGFPQYTRHYYIGIMVKAVNEPGRVHALLELRSWLGRKTRHKWRLSQWWVPWGKKGWWKGRKRGSCLWSGKTSSVRGHLNKNWIEVGGKCVLCTGTVNARLLGEGMFGIFKVQSRKPVWFEQG